jgi:DNA-binding beta-propeller fold protein YncE
MGTETGTCKVCNSPRVALFGLALILICCSDSQESGDSRGFDADATSDGAVSGTISTSGATSTTGGTPDPPPEQELETSFRAPVAAGKYLWSANPESGRVAIIDTETLDIDIADAGFAPTYLAAVPSGDDQLSSAIVINVLSEDATLFGIDAARELSTRTFPLHAGANHWSVAPSGRWATAWTDARAVEAPDPTDGFQDISIIDLEHDRVTRLSVGYRPSQVTYDASESRLFVVTEPGISVIELDADAVETARLIELAGDAMDGVVARDVSITRDGNTALVRIEGASTVRVVPLDGSEPGEIALSGPVTDLDLSDDGSRAVAVVRSKSEVFVLDVARLGASDSVSSLQIPGGLFGSVALSPLADVAILFTNAVDNHEATLISLAEGEDFLSHRSVDLKGPVKAVFVAPDGEHAVALLEVPDGSSKAGAFSIIATKAERAPKIVGTDAPPLAVALSPSNPSASALVTTRDDTARVFEAHLVQLPSLQVDAFRLASPPLATGIIEDQDLGYVAQSHPEGRISFIDLTRGKTQTLTGFELATKVVD